MPIADKGFGEPDRVPQENNILDQNNVLFSGSDKDDRIPDSSLSNKIDKELQEARAKLEKVVQDAEAQKAELIRPPAGKNHKNTVSDNSEEVGFLGKDRYKPTVARDANREDLDSDDDEFQVGYYLDETIKGKIKQGQYVDLSKVLPKDRTTVPDQEEDSGFRLISREGYQFLAKKEEEITEISNYAKWRSAFGVYVAIYLKENPQRSAEVHQYISEIESAAITYVWSNVYGYDKMFRLRIAKKPHKSWATTHQKAWNTFMRDRRHNGQNYPAKYPHSGGNQSTKKQSKNKKKPCWIFNKKGNCKFGENCRFENKCSNCGSIDHGAINCEKPKSKTEKQSKNKKKKKKILTCFS